MEKHCCDAMSHWANYRCEQHADPFECPDHLIMFNSEQRAYGLIVHDGGSAVIAIQHCPWCGAALGAE